MHSLNRRQTLSALAFAAASALCPTAFAQNPALPATIKLVVPLPPGGAVDVVARKIADAMAKHLGTSVIVDNKAGASGMIAARAVASAPADGSVLLYAHSGMLTAQAMGAKVDMQKDLKPVAKLSFGPHFLVVRSDSPYKTQADLVNALKANPGKLNVGSGGNGSPTHLMYEMLEDAIPGVKATHIPFKGAIEANNALIGGEIDFQFALPGVSLEFIKAGKLRVLSFTGATRFHLMPNLPTTAEAGAPGYRAEPWGGLMLPGGASDALTAVFAEAVSVALTAPDVTQFIERTGSIKAAKSTPAEFADEIGKELTQQRAIVKKLGMVNN
ncbi:MAG: tripartite tricarboxylate transporter substrate binding protein [Pseudomonadota bacterium]